jgi:hypothetical protein
MRGHISCFNSALLVTGETEDISSLSEEENESFKKGNNENKNDLPQNESI